MRVTNEGKYEFTRKEHLKCLMVWMTLCVGIGWIFYDSFWGILVGLPLYLPFYKLAYKYKYAQEKRKLRIEFKDAMLSIYSSLSAGATLEEGIRRALKELEDHSKDDSRMVLEFTLLCQKMERNLPLGQCLEEMALRCENQDMINFAQILAMGKKQGGNMAQMVRDSVEKIQSRIEMTYEIEGIIGAKRGEFFFMALIPIGVILYMRVFSPDFMDVLYGNLAGALLMTLCLVVYVGAILLGAVILKVENA